MGTSLYPIGNHNVNFKKSAFFQIAEEIKARLNGIEFKNKNFLRSFAQNWYGKHYIPDTPWYYYKEDEADYFKDEKRIDFYGPFNLELAFDPYKILFFDPPFRYWNWFESTDAETRRQWRFYLWQMLTAFGGNRVIYLADNAHPLESCLNLTGKLEQTECALKNHFANRPKALRK